MRYLVRKRFIDAVLLFNILNKKPTINWSRNPKSKSEKWQPHTRIYSAPTMKLTTAFFVSFIAALFGVTHVSGLPIIVFDVSNSLSEPVLFVD